MQNKLEPIILQKQKEVSQLKSILQTQPAHPIADLLSGKTRRNSIKNFKNALRNSELSIIAEIKRKSPSKGSLASITDPSFLAQTYIEGGANAISILTDELFFGGNIEDLKNIALTTASQNSKPIPLLRKDFTIDEIQIAEAIVAGADAVLLIVAVLGPSIKKMLEASRKMGIDALVEVHNLEELEIALESGADIIGINNRDLTTFEIDTQQALRLLDQIPSQIIRVAESGILDPKIAQSYHRAGFDAVLIGEALVTSENPANFMRACRE